MPKIKTNKTAYKKFRKTAKGKIKRGKAYRSHNTAKKSPKTRRQLRGGGYVDKADTGLIKGLLRYFSKRK